MSSVLLNFVFAIVVWAIAGLIMWAAVKTGQAFWSQTDGENGESSVQSKVAGVAVPLIFMAPWTVLLFITGLGTFLGIIGIQVGSHYISIMPDGVGFIVQ